MEANKALSTRYLGDDLVALLTGPTPEDIIKERSIRGGGRVSYVEGSQFIRRANEAFGFLWSMEVPDYKIELDKNQIVAKVRITVRVPSRLIARRTPDGHEETIKYEPFEVVKEQFGSSEIKRYSETTKQHKVGDIIDLGDDLKSASTDGMKKCLTGFGMFLDVYEKRPESGEGNGVSKQQMAVLVMRGERAGMDEAATLKWAEEQLGKPVSEAQQLEIMSLIPKLIDIEKEKKEKASV